MPEILNTLVRERTNRSQLIDELQKADCFVLVAVDGAGRIVGTAQLDVDADAGSLSACAVAEGGRGIGSALMQARLEIARSLGLTTAWLETDTVNPEGMAHAVRHGLTPVCRRPGRLIPGNVVVRFERQL
jgi:N-acetylglutamate synthase-like GNAT family acetyltransferase